MKLYRYNVRYFLPRHFRCPHCGLGGLVPPLVGLADLLAVAWGAPLRVVSGFRCPEWHRKYAGSTDVASKHCAGLAVDLAPREGVLLGVLGSMARDFCSGFEDVEVFNHPDSVHVALSAGGHVSRFWAGEVISIDVV